MLHLQCKSLASIKHQSKAYSIKTVFSAQLVLATQGAHQSTSYLPRFGTIDVFVIGFNSGFLKWVIRTEQMQPHQHIGQLQHNFYAQCSGPASSVVSHSSTKHTQHKLCNSFYPQINSSFWLLKQKICLGIWI